MCFVGLRKRIPSQFVNPCEAPQELNQDSQRDCRGGRSIVAFKEPPIAVKLIRKKKLCINQILIICILLGLFSCDKFTLGKVSW